MDDLSPLFARAAEVAAAFRSGLAERPVRPQADLDALRAAFGGPLPAGPTAPEKVLEELVAAAEPGLMGSPGPRFFGFVVGGALPAATAADMLTAGWDQNAFSASLGPAGVAVEEAAGTWVKELLGLPPSASVGFVTGAQAANTAGLVSARHHVLDRVGWDVERRGLVGAPAMRVVAGEERHATVDRSLRLLGFGTDTVEPVRAGANGAIDVADLERVLARAGGPTIVMPAGRQREHRRL